ncbi:MAG: hypothetical protein JXQ87_11875 [Bacteroidia bacterium]
MTKVAYKPMISLSDNQIDQVYDVLIDHGLTYETLRDELLDHICCIVEEQMEHGAQFHNALHNAQEQFGPLGIERTQEATIFLLTLKLRKMKKTASILGIIGGVTTILGTLFKVMHWPGAGIMLLVGLAITGLLFMPTALYVNYKSKEGIRDRATIIAGFAGGILLTFFALFKVMHWPGASMLLLISLGELILVFIPLYFVKSYRNPENRWFDIGSLTVIMASIIMVLTLYSVHGPSNGYIESIKSLEQQTLESYKRLESDIRYESSKLSTEKPELENTVSLLNNTNRLIVQAFYQYRNQLLNKEAIADYSYYNQTLEKLTQMGAEDYSNWNSFIQKLELLNDAELNQKQKYVGSIFETLPAIIAEISGKSAGTDEFKGIAQSFSTLPLPNKMGFETSLLYVNYLNLAEFELKTKQLELLKNL